MGPPYRASRTFPARTSSARRARRFVREVLAGQSCPDQLVATVLLLTNETVTNALVHAHAAPEVTVLVATRAVRVEVRDGSSHLPVVRDASAESGSGRGMAIVQALATRWRAETIEGQGKVVWFEVTR
jgi:anti-sigma regulatory factor (Ser/Thr protein kinase)